jgi:DNA-binding PadR family transcriptional regulator
MSDDPVRGVFLGFLRLHILYHALDGPVFGVGLMHELQRQGYSVGPGTLYPTLHALERAGHLQSQEARVDSRARRVYRTTKHGAHALGDGRRRAEALLSAIRPARVPSRARGAGT